MIKKAEDNTPQSLEHATHAAGPAGAADNGRTGPDRAAGLSMTFEVTRRQDIARIGQQALETLCMEGCPVAG